MRFASVVDKRHAGPARLQLSCWQRWPYFLPGGSKPWVLVTLYSSSGSEVAFTICMGSMAAQPGNSGCPFRIQLSVFMRAVVCKDKAHKHQESGVFWKLLYKCSILMGQCLIGFKPCLRLS